MNDKDLKTLADGGIDVKDALERFSGSENLFIKVLNKFLNDTNFNSYTKNLAGADIINAERSVHALKGIAGNLGINEVYKLSAEIDSQLKEGKIPDAVEQDKLGKAYERAISAIREFNEGR